MLVYFKRYLRQVPYTCSATFIFYNGLKEMITPPPKKKAKTNLFDPPKEEQVGTFGTHYLHDVLNMY